MIRYALKCREGHGFESWFQSASAYDALAQAGHVSCAVCGSTDVTKALMAPGVAAEAAAPDPRADAIAKLRREVEQNATYVGGTFAQKARDMHDGVVPETSIYGEASPDEARALIEDGIPVLPLPFKPKQKMQ